MTLVVNDTVGGLDGIIAAPFNFFENKVAEVGNLLSTYQQNAKLSKIYPLSPTLLHFFYGFVNNF